MNPKNEVEDLDCRFFTLSKYSLPSHLIHFILLKHKLKKSLIKTIEEFKPDIIVLASDWTFLIKSVLTAAKQIPVVCEFHNVYDFVTKKIGNKNNTLQSILTKLYNHYSLKYFRRCACLITLTKDDANLWKRHSKKVIVIPNPVTYYPELISNQNKDSGRIIFVGRLNHEKRIDRLIAAFSMIADKYPDWHVDIFGEGNEKGNLIRQIDKSGLINRVVIHEPTKAIYDEYKRSEMLVLCSEYEASSLVLVEAMACGVPCVSLDCPTGPRAIIKNGETGLLAKDGDTDDLASKIEWLITHEPERIEMGRKARIASEKYKPSIVMETWERAYTRIITTTG